MKKLLSIVLVLVLSLSCFSMVSFAETNTTEHLTEVPDGYVGVYTIEDLYCVRNDLTANYILMNDIDLTEATAEGGDWDFYGNGWNPIGSNDVYGSSGFKGIFDGNGYAVKGMRIELKTIPSGASILHLGLFSRVSGAVKNLTVEGNIYASVNTEDGNVYVGGIATYNMGTIDNCINKVEIFVSKTCDRASHLEVGGITGYNGGTISNCINIKDLYGYFNRTYHNNYNYLGSVCVAGISGINGEGGHIENCINTGNITAEKQGWTYSYAAGIGAKSDSEYGTISNCYNRGEITASPSSGGHSCAAGIGYNATCSYSYNVGAVSGYDKYAISNNSSTKCYYLAGVGSDSEGATSLTPAQMKLKSMYSGWDFDTVWTMDGREDYLYPELRDVALVLPEDLLHQHEYTSEITTPATHIAEGVMTYTCECGDTYTEAIEKTTEHTYTSEVTTQPTHFAEGVETFTCECGDSYTEAVAKIAHTYNKVVTAPTCTAQGYTTFNCECGDSYIGDCVDVTDHVDSNGDYKCDYNCGYEFEQPAPEAPDEPQEENDDGFFAKIFAAIISFFDLIFSIFKK